MSKYSEELERQYPTIGKMREATDKIKFCDDDDKDKFWIHRDKKAGYGYKSKGNYKKEIKGIFS